MKTFEQLQKKGMSPALSIDHEFLTKQGWKRFVSLEDELAVFAHPLEYIRPSSVVITPFDKDLVFFENDYVNLLATPDLELHSHNGATLGDLLDGESIDLRLVHTEVKEEPRTVIYRGGWEGADASVCEAIVSGKHAIMRKSANFGVNQEYVVETSSCNSVANPADSRSHLIHMVYSKGSSVISIEMPKKVAICTRRHGKPCWIVVKTRDP